MPIPRRALLGIGGGLPERMASAGIPVVLSTGRYVGRVLGFGGGTAARHGEEREVRPRESEPRENLLRETDS